MRKVTVKRKVPRQRARAHHRRAPSSAQRAASIENRIREIGECYGVDVAAWWEPEFIPEEDIDWPRGAREKQQAAFDAGYAALRTCKRGRRDVPADQQYPRPQLFDVEACLPYAVAKWYTRAVARIALALEDPRTPRDLKRALKLHLRDFLRADGILYEARPHALPSRETKVSPVAQRRFPALHEDLRRVCQRGGSVADVLRVCREHLPSPITIREDQRRALEKIVNNAKKPAKGQTAHVFAKQMLERLFSISGKYVRKLVYEGGRPNRRV